MCVNPLSYQNRLRHFQYLDLFRQQGFSILSEDKTVCEEAVSAIPGMRLATEYQGIDARELAGITSWIVAAA